jgi:hypothetical protein
MMIWSEIEGENRKNQTLTIKFSGEETCYAMAGSASGTLIESAWPTSLV